MRKNLLVAGGLSLLSLLAGATALILAEFGAPAYIFVSLLAWLLTLGLPTLAAVLLLACIWPGPSLGMFAVVAALLAFALQFAAVWAVRHGLRRWRAA